MAFSDSYNGTYQGSATGTFRIDVDVLGGIQGSGPGVASITGQVDEYGRVTFTFPGGTQFTGQFSSDRHSIAGTWTSSSGSGTFVAQSVTAASGTGGAGSGTGGTAGTSGSTPSASVVIAASDEACKKTVTCGKIDAASCPAVTSTTQPEFPQSCWGEELAVYQCIIDNTCESIQSTCEPAYQAVQDCESSTPGGTYPSNPDFFPELTGISSFDDIVHLCTECTAEARACYDSADCKAYAVCVDACPSGDFSCGDLCSVDHSDGYDVYSNAATCQFMNCY